MINAGDRVRMRRAVRIVHETEVVDTLVFAGDTGTVFRKEGGGMLVVYFDDAVERYGRGAVSRQGAVSVADVEKLVVSAPSNAKERKRDLVQRVLGRMVPGGERAARFSQLLNMPDADRAMGLFLQEGFLTPEDIAVIDQESNLELRVMRYPWSDMPHTTQRMLLQGTPQEAVERVMKLHANKFGHLRASPGDEQGGASRRLLRAIAVWARGRRRLIRISEKCQKILAGVASDRILNGLPICRWRSLPAPGSPLYGEGTMFLWEGTGTMTFAAPRGVFLAEKSEFVSLSLTDPDEEWRGRGYRKIWGVSPDVPYILEKGWVEDQTRSVLKLLDALGEDDTADALHLALARSPLVANVHMTINALAALNTTYDIPVFRSRGKKKGQRSTKQVGGMRGVRSLDLDEKGLVAWAAHYVFEKDPTLPGQQEGEEGEESPEGLTHPDRKPPCLHPRGGSVARTWIKPENIKPGETVVAEKEVTVGRGDSRQEVTRLCVMRSRIGCPVGGKFEAIEERLRSGVDDLAVRRMSEEPLKKQQPK